MAHIIFIKKLNIVPTENLTDKIVHLEHGQIAANTRSRAITKLFQLERVPTDLIE